MYLKTHRLFVKCIRSFLNSVRPILYIDLSKFVPDICEKQVYRMLYILTLLLSITASYYVAHHSMSDIQLHTPTLSTREGNNGREERNHFIWSSVLFESTQCVAAYQNAISNNLARLFIQSNVEFVSFIYLFVYFISFFYYSSNDQ